MPATRSSSKKSNSKTPKSAPINVAKPKPEPKPTKFSALDAAAKVLVESTQPMTTREMIDAMATKGYWSSPVGKTPHATLYSGILREIKTKGNDSRFIKSERGKFVSNT